jgi:hypothetical protein
LTAGGFRRAVASDILGIQLDLLEPTDYVDLLITGGANGGATVSAKCADRFGPIVLLGWLSLA